MNKRISKIIMGLLLVLLMGILVGCPTEAPKADDKKGDDGGGGPLPDFSINLSHIGSHEIVASTSVNIVIDGEVTFVITDSETKPTIPAESVTDGFITRTFANPQTRDVYMAQLWKNLPAGENLGTLNTIDTLHGAFMKSDKKYYLHAFYKKQGNVNVTHTSKPFTTTAHRTSGAFFDMVQNIEWKIGKENLTIFMDGYGTERGSIKLGNNSLTIMGIYDPPSSPDPAELSDTANTKVMFFDAQYLFIVKANYPENIDTNVFGIWKISYANTTKETFTVTRITE